MGRTEGRRGGRDEEGNGTVSGMDGSEEGKEGRKRAHVQSSNQLLRLTKSGSFFELCQRTVSLARALKG